MKITKVEEKLLAGVKSNIWSLAFIGITLLAVFMRISGWGYFSGDANSFLLPWFDQIKSLGGLSALKQQIGNYNIPYQTLIALMTYLPIDPLSQYKLLSVVFDFVLASGAAALVYACSEKNKDSKACLAYLIVISLPTVVLNSSVWAQCDSIFTAFAVWSLYSLKKERYTTAFWFLGLSFAFKLQAVFFLPLFLIFYAVEKRFSLLHFLQIPVAVIILSLPALIMGRPVGDIFSVYIGQTDTYESMFLNYPSLYTLFGDDYETLKVFAIALCFIVLILAFLYYIKKYKRIDTDTLLELSVWSIWCCVLLLPAMHERYAFAVDVLSVVLALRNKKYIWVCVAINLVSLISYGNFLFGYKAIEFGHLGILNTAAFAFYTYLIFKKAKEENMVKQRRENDE